MRDNDPKSAQPEQSTHGDAAPEVPVSLCGLTSQGGCSCKVNPALLDDILGSLTGHVGKDILVDQTTRDDAAVVRTDTLFDGGLVLLSTDFQLAAVEDAFDSGVVAAANAVSDIYAMGGRPKVALVMLGFPMDRFQDSKALCRRMMDGIRAACEDSGVVIVGGHTIDSAEPLLGLAVVGSVRAEQLRTNAMAQVGDVVILTKPIGCGIVMAGRKLGMVDDSAYRETVRLMSIANAPGQWLGDRAGVHALTDVTGFGLLGHAAEICKASGVSMAIDASAVPVIAGVPELVASGIWPRASLRNLEAVEKLVSWGPMVTPEQKAILSDAQTNGGLLLTCARSEAEDLVTVLRDSGFSETSMIGEIASDAQRYAIGVT